VISAGTAWSSLFTVICPCGPRHPFPALRRSLCLRLACVGLACLGFQPEAEFVLTCRPGGANHELAAFRAELGSGNVSATRPRGSVPACSRTVGSAPSKETSTAVPTAGKSVARPRTSISNEAVPATSHDAAFQQAHLNAGRKLNGAPGREHCCGALGGGQLKPQHARAQIINHTAVLRGNAFSQCFDFRLPAAIAEQILIALDAPVHHAPLRVDGRVNQWLIGGTRFPVSTVNVCSPIGTLV